ncbi:hypothetical protein [Rhodococcus sp. 077-4]|uniref:hypothetical protein n=1 Tax=Rhodococcus sp. 077-4 TaxID=2789271 RepID=UPI0039F521F0
MSRFATPFIAAIAVVSFVGWIASFGALARWGLMGGIEKLCMRIPGALYEAHWAWLPVPVANCVNYVDSDVAVGTTIGSWENTGSGGACAVVFVVSMWIVLRRMRSR